VSRRRRSQAQNRRLDKATGALPARVTQAGGTVRPIPPAQQQAAQQHGLTPWMYGGTPFTALGRTDPQVPFGPGLPLIPAPLDPTGPQGRTAPRQSEYPISWNLPGFGDRPIPWGTLRAAAQVDLVRDCISLLKKEISGLEWSIAIAEEAVDDLMAAGEADRRVEAKKLLRAKLGPDITRARQFWRRPDPQNGLGFNDWLWGALEEILVLDAWPLFPYKALGGNTLGLRTIDGSTIKPLIDHLGLRPSPPNPAFQQLLHGFPRGEYTASIGKDGAVDGGFTADELLYHRREIRAWTPYGLSPVEACLARVNLWLKRIDWMTKEWDSGSLPQAMMEIPPESRMTPDDLIRWREAINNHLGGDAVERHRIQVGLPGGKLSRLTDAADAYKPDYDTFIVKLVCSSFGIAPAELGFMDSGGLGGASYHEGQDDIQQRKGITPWTTWLAGIFNEINVRYLGVDPAIEFRFSGLEEEDDAATDAMVDARLKSGRITLNEARDAQGSPPYPFPEADQPFIFGGVPTWLEGQKEIAEAQAQAQVAGAQMAAQNLKAGKLPSGKDPNTPKGERAEGDEPTPNRGTPTANSEDHGAGAKPAVEEKADDTEADAEKAARADELGAFGRWASKAAKGRAAPPRPFAFTFVDADTGRQLNQLAADGLAAEASALAKTEAAALRKAGGDASGEALPSVGGWQGFAAHDALLPHLSRLVSRGARRLIDPAATAQALHDRWPQGSSLERTALVGEIRKVLGEHARLGALAPALTEIYRTGWAAGEQCAEEEISLRGPAELGKAAAGAERHPAGTERLMEYWAHGEGAARIRWGQPNDYDRCVVEVGKHVPGRMVHGLCANLHHRALGVWPGQEDGGRRHKGAESAGLVKAFDPGELRDWHGRWSVAPGGGLDAMGGRHRAPRRGGFTRPGHGGGHLPEVDPPTDPLVLPAAPVVPAQTQRQIDSLAARYGPRLDIHRPDDPGVQRAIDGLSTVPGRHHELIDRALGSEGSIFITPGHPATHPFLRGTATGRWALQHEPNLHGAWSEKDRELMLGGRRDAHVTAVHEAGHAIDSALGRPSQHSSFRPLAESVQQLFPADYYRQPYPTGLRELWAHAYMGWIFNLGAPREGSEIGKALEIPNRREARQAGDALAAWFRDHLPL